MVKSRATFGSRYGFYMAAIGTAVGLGNVWRFPYIVGVNGGGAFILMYLLFVAAIAMPILIGELMLGKITRRNFVGALKAPQWPGRFVGWSWFGRLAMIACLVVLSYYTVVSGWVLYYVGQAFSGGFTGNAVRSENIIDKLLASSWLQLALTGIHLLLTASVVSRGVQNGIEKVARYLMPVLFVTIVFLVANSALLPSASEAFRFLFYPDFSKLTANAPIEALGHALFSLSLGFGAMVAYGSYLQKEVHVPGEAVYIATLDTLFSLAIGVVIFPVVFAARVEPSAGPSLLFKTMPVLLGQLPMGYWLGIAFFLCLYFSALMSSINLFEGVVAYMGDELKIKRSYAAVLVSLVTFSLGIFSAFSATLLKNVKLGERGLLVVIDQVIINWTLPVVCLGTALYVSRRIPEEERRAEFADPASLVSTRLYSTWTKYIKWVAPVSISLLIVFQIIIAVVRN